MAGPRLSRAAQADIVGILAWSHENFGEDVRTRYERLIATAIRDAARRDDVGRVARPELGEGVFSWHLVHSRSRSPGPPVRHPRHFLICRDDGELLVVGRILHDARDLRRHIDPGQTWR